LEELLFPLLLREEAEFLEGPLVLLVVLEELLFPLLLREEAEFLEGPPLVLLVVLEELLFPLFLRVEARLLVEEPARFDELLLVDEFPLVDGFCLMLLVVFEELLLVALENFLVGFATTELDLLVVDEFGCTLLVLLLEVTAEYLEFAFSILYELL
jgi:hypothetical protein